VEKIYYRRRLSEIIDALKQENKTIGFVPTMGALHQGHISLIQRAIEDCDFVICCIFVNPKQFNNSGDLDNYPRLPEKDAELLEQAGCDLTFFPSVDEVYPEDFKPVELDLGLLESVYEGKYRPGHFDGVVQVLNRLFELTQPDKSYFGIKDIQQCMVVEALQRAYHPTLEVVRCATLRETDGLAMSSRNLRLSEKERSKAPHFSKCLREICEAKGKVPLNAIVNECKDDLTSRGFVIDYIDVANAKNLEAVSSWEPEDELVVVGAVFLGEVRLIDNMQF
jgi:pantoate--beta-alanine ligase